MKRTLLKTLAAIAFLLCSITVFAEDFEVDGIYYYITSETEKTVEVTYGNSTYTGSVVIPETITYSGTRYSVTEIGISAFEGCSELTEVTIANSVTSIGNCAFNGCSGLAKITIPENVTYLGAQAFDGCLLLSSVEWNAINCKTYEDEYEFYIYPPFYDYNSGSCSVAEFVFGNKVENIPDGLCYGMTKLVSITIPNSVTSIGDGAFNDCDGLMTLNFNAENCTTIGRDRYIPPVFHGCTSLTTLNIGESVKIIPDFAFYFCIGLTEVTIPNSVTSIGERAFASCDGLTAITIPNSVTSIGDWAFFGCELTSVTIPNSVTSIGEHAFSECNGLTSILVAEDNSVYDSRENCNAIIETTTNTLITGCNKTIIPNSVTSIGKSAFYGCHGFTSITIPNSVTSIGDGAFGRCSRLTSVTIPNSVTSIGECAFSKCNGLTSILVAEDNSVYDSRENCNAIIKTATNALIQGCKNTIIPNSVTSIGIGAFYGCHGFTSITIPNSVTSIGDGAFGLCTGLTEIAIPNSVTSIGDAAFSNCGGLTEVTIGNSVTSIGDWAFSNCGGLTKVTIGNSVTSIGDLAFYDCYSIKDVYAYPTVPPTIYDNTFTSYNATLHTAGIKMYMQRLPIGNILPISPMI